MPMQTAPALAAVARAVKEAGDASVGAERRVRIARIAGMLGTEDPVPTRQAIAARLGVSVATVQRDMGTREFATELETALADQLSDVVGEVIRAHLREMREAEKASDRLAAGRWLYARWQGVARAAAAIRGGDEPARAVAAESELLAQVMRETEASREKK